MSVLESLQAPALVMAMVLVPIVLLLGLLTLWKRFVRNRNRRSPLTSELLRSPGFGLQERIEEITEDISGNVFGIVLLPLVFFGIHRAQTEMAVPVNPRVTGVLFVAAVLVGFVYLRRRDAGYPAPPAQSRTCGFPASGSSVVLAFAQAKEIMQTPVVQSASR